MHIWKLRFLGKSHKQIAELEKQIQAGFKKAIEELISCDDPTNHPKSKTLCYQSKGEYRIRVGKYRMIYTLDAESKTVNIHKIGIRDKFYTE